VNSVTVYQKLVQSIGWNACESIVYHVLYALHQIVLFNTVPYEEYGRISVAFSMLYLAVWILDLGFDTALCPFWFFWSQSKKRVVSFLTYNSIPTIIAWILLSIAIMLVGTFHGYHVAPSLRLITSIAIAAEIVRRLSKTILQLLFKNRDIAVAELIFIGSYISCVWSIWAMGIPLTVYTTVAPLLASSLISALICLTQVLRWYRALADQSNTDDELHYSRIARFRLYSYGNSMGTLFFSSNFLVPLFGLKFGASHAGLLKLSGSVVHSITIVLQKTFGNACKAILANTRSNNDITQKEAFCTITRYLYQLLYGLLIFCIINHRFLIHISGAADLHSGILLILFFVISLLDNFAITYEKLYEINERPDLLCLFNGIGTLLMMILITSSISAVPLLVIMTLIRISILALTGCMTFAIYRISPYQTIEPIFILGMILLSLCFFLFFGNT